MREITPVQAVLRGGRVGGALDLLFAVGFAAGRGAMPEKVFQTIASGLLGARVRGRGSGLSAGLCPAFRDVGGLGGVFVGASRRVPALLRHPVASTLGFGVLVFLTMRLVVLPLSAHPRPVTFAPLATVLDLLSHVLLFAGPIAQAARRVALRR